MLLSLQKPLIPNAHHRGPQGAPSQLSRFARKNGPLGSCPVRCRLTYTSISAPLSVCKGALVAVYVATFGCSVQVPERAPHYSQTSTYAAKKANYPWQHPLVGQRLATHNGARPGLTNHSLLKVSGIYSPCRRDGRSLIATRQVISARGRDRKSHRPWPLRKTAKLAPRAIS